MVVDMKIIAHRGNDGIHKENTLEAIINSLNSKYTNGVEFDIRVTKDNKFVICHDLFYNGHYIKNTRLKTLQRSGLNSLNEVLKNINSQKTILIEIKEEGKKYKFVNKLINVLKRYPLNYYICTFNYNLLKYLQNKNVSYKLGLIIGYLINEKRINNNFDFNSINIKDYTKTSKETFVWTVNNTKDMPKEDVGIITDKAKEIYTYLKSS